VADLRVAIGQHDLDGLELARSHQSLDHHFAEPLAGGDHQSVLRPGGTGAVEQLGVGQALALLQQGPGDPGLIMQQQPGQLGRRLCQTGEATGNLQPLVGGGIPQHLDQKVCGDGPFEGVDPARRQAHHIGQPPQQGASGAKLRGRRIVRKGRALAHLDTHSNTGALTTGSRPCPVVLKTSAI
jgi:hypothetical protein